MRYIGPHVSISESIALAPLRAHSYGATGFALFSKNQRMWRSPKLKEEEITEFKNNLESLGFKRESILPHAGYLINPASPDKELQEKSLNLFLDEMSRLNSLGLKIINIHPGAYKEGEKIDGIKRSANMINEVLKAYPDMRVSIENTAGAGTIIGSTFEELATIYSFINEKERVGFTLDTAHLYGAGYDVKNEINVILDNFFSLLGKDKLFGMHLNDSKVPLASNKDRHENIGKGFIGKEAFYEIVKRKETESIPLILETPDQSLWESEIKELLNASK